MEFGNPHIRLCSNFGRHVFQLPHLKKKKKKSKNLDLMDIAYKLECSQGYFHRHAESHLVYSDSCI